MSFGKVSFYIIIFILSCLNFFSHYKFINYVRRDLTIKQKAYILSIKNSITLFLFGLYFNYYYFLSDCNEQNYLNILDNKNLMGILAIIYFSAFLATDIYIGNKEYPEYMKTLSGNIHHFVYLIINVVSLYFNVYPIYILYMLSELPSFLMSIGSFNSELRNDDLFGATFFMTRIVYHIILVMIFRKDSLLFYPGICSLALHCYWFYNWFIKYGFKGKTNEKTTMTKNRKQTKKRIKKSKILS